MPHFGKRSLHEISTLDPRLQAICHEAIKEIDFVVLKGYRGKDEQHDAFLSGHSQLDWPKSRHNSQPSEAMDLAPYPIDWKDQVAFERLAVVVTEIAERLGVEITWGGDFSFRDLPHFELKRKSGF